MGLAWFIVVVMPIVGIVVFWKLHILPEKIAEKRHHPQKDAIQVLCLLSLVFGGLLWPIAWLWAYTRPTTSFLAYGTEKHEDYFHDMARAVARRQTHAPMKWTSCARSSTPWPPSRDCRAKLKVLRRELDAATRVASRSTAGGPPDGSHPPCHLWLLRLADLHQVQVAALEHHLADHRRHHPDRRAWRR